MKILLSDIAIIIYEIIIIVVLLFFVVKEARDRKQKKINKEKYLHQQKENQLMQSLINDRRR